MKIGIFQPYLDNQTKALIKAPAIPFDFTDNPDPGSREILIYQKIMDQGLHEQFDLAGMLSYKFEQKTGLTVQDVLSWVQSQPGFDIYLINCKPADTIFHYNIWTNGERAHPGLMQATRPLFQKFGLPQSAFEMPWNDPRTCYSNYWIATPEFWNDYFTFLNPIHDYVRQETMFNQNASYAGSPELSLIPFIHERMLTTFLYLKDGNYRFLSYPFSPENERYLLNKSQVSYDRYKTAKDDLLQITATEGFKNQHFLERELTVRLHEYTKSPFVRMLLLRSLISAQKNPFYFQMIRRAYKSLSYLSPEKNPTKAFHERWSFRAESAES